MNFMIDDVLNDVVTGALKFEHTSRTLHIAAEAFFQGYKILVPEDCVEALNKEAQKFGLNYLTELYECKITHLDELMKMEPI